MAGKVTLHRYDGLARGSTRVWVQNLNTYLNINPMRETNAIKFSMLH